MKQLRLFLLIALSALLPVVGWGQTIDNSATGTSGTIPSGWSSVNGVTTNTISQTGSGGYYLLESTSPSTYDYLISASYNIPTADVSIAMDIATYGSGTSTTLSVDMSTDNGATWAAGTKTTGSVTSSTHITQTVTFIGVNSGTVKFRFYDGQLGLPSVRLKNIVISKSPPPCTPPANPNGTISGTTPACSSTTLSYAAGAGQPEAGVTYYWQTAASGTSTANVATSPLNVAASGSYYVRAYNGSCWSAGATAAYAVTINTLPSITAHPNTSPLTTCSGTAFSTPNLSVTASNAASYQWYSNTTASNAGGTPVGTNSATYTVPNNTPGTLYYYVVVSGNAPCASVTSNVSGARTVNPIPADPNGTISGTSPACTSTTLTYTPGTGQPESGVTYYWQTAVKGNLTGADAANPLTVYGNQTTYVRAVIGTCWSAGSTAGLPIVVNNNPAISGQPADKSTGDGANATFAVTATNPGGYQWQESSGAGFANITNGGKYSGATTATLTITGATLSMNGYQYRAVVSPNAPCAISATSSAATLTVTPTSKATDYFRSRATGLYGQAATWESSADSITWMNATAFPTNAARSVTIRATDSVTVSVAGRSAAHLYVFGKLTLDEQDLAIADSSGYDVVIFNGGRFDCGTLNAGSELSLATGATVLVKTGGRIIIRVSNALAGPGRSTEYYYEDRAVLEYAGSQPITNSGQTYFPSSTPGTSPLFLFSKFPPATVVNGNSPITFNGRVEFAVGAGITWKGTGAKIFRDGLTNNGTILFDNPTPFEITGTNAILEGSGTITIGTSGMSIDASASVKLLSDMTINSASGTLTVSGTLNTNGHILSGTAKFATAANSTLVITDAAGIAASGASGNIQTTGTRTFSTSGSYVYRGTAAQATGNGLPASSATLEIDNSAGVTLGAAHTANTELKLTSGNLTTSATNLLTLGSGAALTGGSAASYIDGPLKRNTAAATGFVFPIGKGSSYVPVTITPQAATASNYTAEYFFANKSTPNRQNIDASLKFVAANEYFDISRGAGAAAQIALSYTSAAQVTDPATLVVAHYNGTQWVSEGQSARSGSNNAGTVTSTNFVNSFSPFALGSTSSSQPLPVQLLAFNLHKNESAARLEWELATTDGDEQIVVERSANGADFVPVSRHAVRKAERLQQSFTDVLPLAGQSFYRLRIVSANGAVHFSKVLSVRFDGPEQGWSLYPNPVQDVLHLAWTDATTPVHLRMYSATGQRVYAESVSGRDTAEISVRNLATGVYWLVMEQGGRTERRQVRVER